jgi:hypothetical protein
MSIDWVVATVRTNSMGNLHRMKEEAAVNQPTAAAPKTVVQQHTATLSNAQLNLLSKFRDD